MEYIEKTLTAIITHNTSSITFTDDFITDNSIIDVYFSSDDIVPTNQEQIGNRLIISIEPKNYDVSIAVHITNDDTINYADDIDNINDKINGLNASNINYDEHSTLFSAMGDIDSLETESKNLVGAINENFLSVSNGKTLIADAITDKGVTTSATDSFQTMANNIGQISGGGGTRQTINLLPRTSEKSWVDSSHINKYDISNKTAKFDDYLTYDDATGKFIPTQKAKDDDVIFIATLETNSYQTARSSKSQGSIDQAEYQVLIQTAPDRTVGSYVINKRYIYNLYSIRTRTPSSDGYPRQYLTIDVLV